MADLTRGKPKAPQYNPYATPQKQVPVVRQLPSRYTRQPRYAVPRNACSRRLDKTTRSRNALIIALIVFLILFLLCLALLIIYLPKLLASATNKQSSITFQVTSVLKNATYDPTLDDPTSYPAVLLNTTLCGYVNDAIKNLTTVLKCGVSEYSDGSPGVKSTMNVTASLAGKTADLADATEEYMFKTLSDAVVASANKDANWQLTSSDIKLIPGAAALASSVVAQMPLLLFLLFIRKVVF